MQQPRLPSWQTDHRAAPLPAYLLPRHRPPLATLCGKRAWGSGRRFPRWLAYCVRRGIWSDWFRPSSHENYWALSSYPFFAPVLDIPLSPKELLIAPAAHLPAAITPLRTPRARAGAGDVRRIRVGQGHQPASDGIRRPLCARTLPPPRPISTWLRTTVGSLLPQGASCSTVVANRVEHGPVYGSASVFQRSRTSRPPLQLRRQSPAPFRFSFVQAMSISAPAMPLWSSTRPLWREARRLPVTVSERQSALERGVLAPLSPSPLSLVTWSQSLSISIPACNPSNLGGPAPIGVSAIQGRPQALRPWSPSRRVIPAHTVAAAARRSRVGAGGADASLPAATGHSADSSGQRGNGAALSCRGPRTTGLHAHASAGCSAFRSRAGDWPRGFGPCASPQKTR